ncbi:MAG: histidine kinase [Actinomycetota bacterium]
MTPRARLPWAIAAIAALVFATTLILMVLNGSFGDPFLYFAIAMVLGYTSVGTVVASRRPENRVGWLLMVIGIAFLVSGFTVEYVRYSFITRPGGLSFGTAAAWVTNWTFNVVTGAVLLMVALYPTGRVHARGWRFLPPLIVGLTTVLILGAILRPGPLDTGYRLGIENPTGVDALGPTRALEVIETALAIVLVFAALASVAALVHRYRRSGGEERQKLRLFVYATVAAAVCLAASAAAGATLGEGAFVTEALFLATFALMGIGVPAAIGVAMLRYRLLEVDVVIRKTVVYGILAVLLTAVFLVAAGILGRFVAGAQTGAPGGATLALLAAFLVGALTAPLWRLSRRIADRVVFGGRANPYEVLATFGGRMAGEYSTDEVLPRMAEVLGTATGATRALIWLRVGGELRPSGVWPEAPVPEGPLPMRDDALPAFPGREHAAEVRHQRELLGALSVSMPASDPMTPSKEKLVRDLAQHAGLVLRNVRLIEELRASRKRLVSAQDEERRRLERDIHDGAQQQLVALAVNLRLARTLAEKDVAKATEMLDRLQGEVQEALGDLRDLARGIYPPLLADRGLVAALEAQARKSPVPVEVEGNGVGRFPQEAEAAVYFCVLEALQNAAKYAEASRVQVRLQAGDGQLRFSVTDDGRGFDPATTPSGSGLQNMADRVEALSGTLEVRSVPGQGTRVSGRLPVDGGGR